MKLLQTLRKIKACEGDVAAQLLLEAYVAQEVAAERERWQRIATNAQAVTTGCADKLDYFEVPSHLMAALALALDEGPNVRAKAAASGGRALSE